MLEHIVPHLDFAPKEALMEEIKQAILTTPLAELKRSLSSVLNRYNNLQHTNGPAFKLGVVNFVLWINKTEGIIHTDKIRPPEMKVYSDPHQILLLLPYHFYDIKVRPEAVLIVDITPSITPTQYSEATVGTLTRRVDENKVKIRIHLLYNYRHCQIMWVREDGLTSIRYDTGYLVRPLKELLNGQ